MKGPYERLKYDLRRVWECPECRHRERTDGCATGRYCKCQQKRPAAERVAMKLVEDGPRRVRAPAATSEKQEPESETNSTDD